MFLGTNLSKSKFLLTIFFIFAGFFIFEGYSFAAVDCTIGVEPRPEQLICPFLKIVNFLMLFGAIVLTIVIAYGAVKLGSSLGDPKGLQSAQKTWLYAFIGFGVVAGAVAIVSILNTTFGFGLQVSSLSSYIGDWWTEFIQEILNIK